MSIEELANQITALSIELKKIGLFASREQEKEKQKLLATREPLIRQWAAQLNEQRKKGSEDHETAIRING